MEKRKGIKKNLGKRLIINPFFWMGLWIAGFPFFFIVILLTGFLGLGNLIGEIVVDLSVNHYSLTFTLIPLLCVWGFIHGLIIFVKENDRRLAGMVYMILSIIIGITTRSIYQLLINSISF